MYCFISRGETSRDVPAAAGKRYAGLALIVFCFFLSPLSTGAQPSLYGPALSALPDMVVSDREQNSQTMDLNFFVFSDALDLDAIVTDVDTTRSLLRWCFVESTSASIEINGIGSYRGSNFRDPGAFNIRAASRYVSVRNTLWSPKAGSPPFPNPPVTSMTSSIALYVSDGTSVDSAVITIVTVNTFFTSGPSDTLVFRQTPDAPRLQIATTSDLNSNGIVDAGDQMVLTLDRSVVVTTSVLAPSHFFLPVAGDSLGGAGFAVGVNPYNSGQIVLTLGAGVYLTPAGQFSTATLTPNAPSGIDFAASLPFGSIRSFDGISAVDGGRPGVDDSGVDIELSMVGRTGNIGPGGGTIALVPSPDAAYTRHSLAVPAGALTSPTQFTLRPPEENLGVINAVQIESSDPTVTFAQPATVSIEYREGDIDWERGQLEWAMRVHQLVEKPLGSLQYVQVPGTHTAQTAFRGISVGVSNLNPCDSLGTIRVFAGLPIETVEERTIHMRPGGSGGGDTPRPALLTTGCLLAAGPNGAYALHRIEFPGYVETATTDPLRLVVTIRTALLAERLSRSGGQSFPTQSDAVFVVTVRDAAGQPFAFSDPVVLTVQFSPAPTKSHVVRFDGQPGLVRLMRLVRDVQVGEAVDFRSLAGVTQRVNVSPGSIVVENLTGLTGADGQGTYGAVSGELSSPAARWHLYR